MQINLRRIKAERVFKKISQAQMAKKLGISRTSYAKKRRSPVKTSP
ncbi:helix-turn-helix domain-containing protein [Lactobacillus iners]|nr:helix-turn-helix transcriptional regulator [Lactobacillus iners]MCT7682427.1 helix-turn-helix transcriptional regulator [Lactobacillus iners]MCT7766343.1 helix-turn-helix transcriptional regulator [Lactobacillus iners]MCT7767651.1 helix-turn-helix transcriptional regulator [Lactobacillus iners]MCT7786404.1 helix-turn-helix transcriptional regulator [Lactobacillus iners]MCT7786717.1 helix-turn-helix transcriptional regulator [Lactobacillus iners]